MSYTFVLRDGTRKNWVCHELPRVGEWVRDPDEEFEWLVDKVIHPTAVPAPGVLIVVPEVQLGQRMRIDKGED